MITYVRDILISVTSYVLRDVLKDNMWHCELKCLQKSWGIKTQISLELHYDMIKHIYNKDAGVYVRRDTDSKVTYSLIYSLLLPPPIPLS